MIIKSQADVTQAVLAEIQRAESPRFREIMTAAVNHLHGFARDAKLTEIEFHQVCGYIAKLGQATTESHNEVVLAAGSLGVSALVCLLNNGNNGQPKPPPILWALFGAWIRRPCSTALLSCMGPHLACLFL